MSPHVAAWMVVAAIGAVAGTARFFAARERHRRAKADMRGALAGIDGLAGRIRATARTMFHTLGVVALVAAVLAVLVYIGGRKP